MKEIYKKYFLLITSPWENQGDDAFGLFQMILLSWPFIIFRALVEFLITYLYIDMAEVRILEQLDYTQVMGSLSSSGFNGTILISFIQTVLTMFFFPFSLVFDYLILLPVFKFYKWFLRIEVDNRNICSEMVNSSFSSYAFSVVPIIGDFAQKISKFIILNKVLKRRFQVSQAASLLILLTPLILGFFAFLSMFLMVFIILSSSDFFKLFF